MRQTMNPTAGASFGDDIVLVILLSLIITIQFKWIQYLFDSITSFFA